MNWLEDKLNIISKNLNKYIVENPNVSQSSIPGKINISAKLNNLEFNIEKLENIRCAVGAKTVTISHSVISFNLINDEDFISEEDMNAYRETLIQDFQEEKEFFFSIVNCDGSNNSNPTIELNFDYGPHEKEILSIKEFLGSNSYGILIGNNSDITVEFFECINMIFSGSSKQLKSVINEKVV